MHVCGSIIYYMMIIVFRPPRDAATGVGERRETHNICGSVVRDGWLYHEKIEC